MSITRLRSRFLVAMGVSAASLGCSKEKSAGAPADAATASPSTTASAPLARHLPTGGGGCGSIAVCTRAASVMPKLHAAKPFERCAATIAEDTNAEEGAHREGTFDAALTTERRTSSPDVCCYDAPRMLCGGGRPLRAGLGEPIVAAVVARRDWIDAAIARTPATPDEARAERWLRDAASEHASVASFARVSLQLLALGAPPELLAAAHDAAKDEIEHARACLALAERRGAPVRGPGPLEVDRAALETTIEAFVAETFRDGCVAETAAAIDARQRCADGDDVERAVLTRIADDEERHAELAWRMLAWALRTGGACARAALERAAADAGRAAAPGDRVVFDLALPCAAALVADA